MDKRTLKFATLKELTDFSKTLATGFLINTKNLTLTAALPDIQLAIAVDMHNATVIETTEKVYSYDLV